MSRYSFEDNDYSARNVDDVSSDFTPADCHGRDCDTFSRTCDADSPHEYGHALLLDIDERLDVHDADMAREASPHTHVRGVSRLAFELLRDSYDERVARYLNRFVSEKECV